MQVCVEESSLALNSSLYIPMVTMLYAGIQNTLNLVMVQRRCLKTISESLKGSRPGLTAIVFDSQHGF